jgi:excinuclease UvrABC nuclease subunit
LLREFGSLERLRATSVDDLAAIVSRPQAERIQEFLARPAPV